MSHRVFFSVAIGSLLAFAAAPVAHATLFSFASDVNSNAFTFAGTTGTGGFFGITDFSRPNTFNLLIDDNNGPLPTLSIPVELHANITASAGQSTQIAPDLFQHTYRVEASITFVSAMGVELLTLSVPGTNPGVLTVPGTQTAWSSTGAVLAADSYAGVNYRATSALVTAMGGAAAAAQYGIVMGPSGVADSVGPDDMAFDLTVINSGSVGTGVPIDAATKAPTAAWRCESSFSGSAFGGIPSPGTAGVGAVAALLALRRRRAK